jgi:hypothetical protein
MPRPEHHGRPSTGSRFERDRERSSGLGAWTRPMCARSKGGGMASSLLSSSRSEGARATPTPFSRAVHWVHDPSVTGTTRKRPHELCQVEGPERSSRSPPRGVTNPSQTCPFLEMDGGRPGADRACLDLGLPQEIRAHNGSFRAWGADISGDGATNSPFQTTEFQSRALPEQSELAGPESGGASVCADIPFALRRRMRTRSLRGRP